MILLIQINICAFHPIMFLRRARPDLAPNRGLADSPPAALCCPSGAYNNSPSAGGAEENSPGQAERGPGLMRQSEWEP